MDEATRLIEKNSLWIWKNVHSFVASLSRKNCLRCDKEDLYQECCMQILHDFRKANTSVEDFRISPMDLRHVMCRYVQNQTPATGHGRRTTDFTAVMKNSVADDLADHEADFSIDPLKDHEFRIVNQQFAKGLNDRDRQAFRIILDGGTWYDVKRQMNLVGGQLTRTINRIGKLYREQVLEGQINARN